MRLEIKIPEGTKDRLFDECVQRRHLRDCMTQLFRRRGYAEVMTPEVEFYDLFVQSGNPLPQEMMLKIIDRSGKIMVMRPDSTAPIARVAATRLKNHPMPCRLYYDQTVYRSGDAHDGGSREIAQCGVELIGAAGLKADIEMIAIAVDALLNCGLRKFHIEIGHAGFFSSLADKFGLTDGQRECLRACMEGKNFASLESQLSASMDDTAYQTFQCLPYLFGGVEALDEAEELTGSNESIGYLRHLYTELDRAGYAPYIRFDLGLVHQIDYYTGVLFRGYAEGAGTPVLSGGRYDKLVERFGLQAEATGFAVDVDVVGSCLTDPIVSLNSVIHYDHGELSRALQILDAMPEGSCELSSCSEVQDTINLAKERGAVAVIIVESGVERRVEL